MNVSVSLYGWELILGNDNLFTGVTFPVVTCRHLAWGTRKESSCSAIMGLTNKEKKQCLCWKKNLPTVSNLKTRKEKNEKI